MTKFGIHSFGCSHFGLQFKNVENYDHTHNSHTLHRCRKTTAEILEQTPHEKNERNNATFIQIENSFFHDKQKIIQKEFLEHINFPAKAVFIN